MFVIPRCHVCAQGEANQSEECLHSSQRCVEIQHYCCVLCGRINDVCIIVNLGCRRRLRCRTNACRGWKSQRRVCIVLPEDVVFLVFCFVFWIAGDCASVDLERNE